MDNILFEAIDAHSTRRCAETVLEEFKRGEANPNDVYRLCVVLAREICRLEDRILELERTELLRD